MLTIRAMSDGKGYSCRHLEHSDYYAEGERVRGFWRGRGAKLLGLDGETRSDDFESLRQGLEPGTGKFLRPRKSADRIPQPGLKSSMPWEQCGRFPGWTALRRWLEPLPNSNPGD